MIKATERLVLFLKLFNRSLLTRHRNIVAAIAVLCGCSAVGECIYFITQGSREDAIRRTVSPSFDFNEHEVGPIASMAYVRTGMTLAPKVGAERWVFRLGLLLDCGETRFLELNRDSSFREADGVLYVAEPDYCSYGGSIRAISLTNGEMLWERRLRAVGPLTHSMYYNRVNVRINEDKVVVLGHEAYGDYCEIFDRTSGRSLAHTIFRQGYIGPRNGPFQGGQIPAIRVLERADRRANPVER